MHITSLTKDRLLSIDKLEGLKRQSFVRRLMSENRLERGSEAGRVEEWLYRIGGGIHF